MSALRCERLLLGGPDIPGRRREGESLTLTFGPSKS